MNSFIVIFGYTLCFLGGIAAAVYLVMNGHSWFAFFILCITSLLHFKSGDKATESKTED